MKWRKFRLKTTVAAEDIISAMLQELGIEGVEIENQQPLSQMEKEQLFADILPAMHDGDGVSFLSFYVNEKVDEKKLLNEIRNELDSISTYIDTGECVVEESWTEDIDWINNWKEHFHSFYIDDILIAPSWEEVKEPDQDKLVIRIDPGTAFGTGMHETTQLCIRQLRKYVTDGMRVLDVGCGSGILGMLALKFGAAFSVGTDLDPCAIEVTHENMTRNEIADCQYQVMIGNIITDRKIREQVGYEMYDIVVANILADVLTVLTPIIKEQLKSGGIYITSGILEGKEQEVTRAIKASGLVVTEITRLGEWVSVTARKIQDF